MRDQYNMSGDFRGASIHVGHPGTSPAISAEDAWARFAEMAALVDLPTPSPLPAGSGMPWSVNPLFIARSDSLIALAKHLCGGAGATALVQSAAAAGLGGIGKTQVAIEFAHRYGQYFAGGVFWINCSDSETIASQVAACGGPGRLDLHPEFDQLALPARAELVRQKWAEAYPRLIIFDNCESEEVLAAWRPTSGGARVLLTSRRSAWSIGLGVRVQTLEVFDRPDSVRLLLSFGEDSEGVDGKAINEIAGELGDLPLALHLAGCFMSRHRYVGVGAPSTYLAAVRERALKHSSLVEGDWSPTGHDQNVERTFDVSYSDLDPGVDDDKAAIQILGILCCYAPGEHIPRVYIRAHPSETKTHEDQCLEIERAFRRLSNLGLIEDRGSTIVVHRLVAAFVIERIDPELHLSVERGCLAAAEDSNFVQDSRFIAAWETHLSHMASAALRRGSPFAEGLNRELATHHYHSGNYDASRTVNEARLSRADAERGDDSRLARALNDMAVSVRPFDPDRAAELLRKSLELQLASPDDHELSLLKTYINLGEALYGSEEARACFEEARRRFSLIWYRPSDPQPDASREASEIGDEDDEFSDPDRVWARIICGLAKSREDDRAEADLLSDLAPESPDDDNFRHWEVLFRLGLFRQAAGDFGAAEKYLLRAQAIIEDAFGSKSPLLGDVLAQLASLYASAQRWSASRDCYLLAFARAHAALGWNHPATKTCSDGIIWARTALREFEELKSHLNERWAHLSQTQTSKREKVHVLFALGLACSQTADVAAAVQHWRNGLKLANRDPLNNRESIRGFKDYLTKFGAR